MDISIAMAIGLSIFLFPLLLFVGGKFKLAPSLRFKIAALLIFSIWCLTNLILEQQGNVIGWRWFAGGLCISAVLLISFMFWSVLCWGYTLSMLLCLAENNSVKNQKQWECLYAGPEGIRKLSTNRTAVLIGLHFAFIEKNQLVLTKFGLFSAAIIQTGGYLFGIAL